MLDIAICEDERFQQGELEEMLYTLGKKLGIYLEVSVYERGESLLADVNHGVHYDVIYLDIEMDGMDGLHVAEELRSQDRTVQIINVTQYECYLHQSIDTMPSGYLVKPVNPEEFKKVFQRISSWIQGKDAYYRFTCDKIPRKVLLKDILYFRSKLRQVEIVCEDNSHLIYQKLNEIERELAAENQKQFLRIHQSYLVNYNHIRCFGHNWVELQTGKRLPMSRGRREVVEKRLEGASM